MLSSVVCSRVFFSFFVVSLSGATLWCHPLVSISGVIRWCHSLVSLSGITLWCHSLESLFGVSHSGELDELGELGDLDDSCNTNCIDGVQTFEKVILDI